ncbi:MAG: hypothetical protein ACRDDZ_13695 [Marinifilaceae bacterium]
MNIRNIKVIAHYESKLLQRSWMYRLFVVFMILFLCFYVVVGFTDIVNQNQGIAQRMCRIASILPYMLSRILFIFQPLLIVFLACGHLLKGVQTETKEVLFVRALTNGDYILGKAWGMFRAFLFLNVFACLVGIFVVVVINGMNLEIEPYLVSLLLISIPTVIFAIGLSYVVTLLTRNRAVSIILCVGYMGMSMFYWSDVANGVFDLFGFHFPLIGSDITGLPDLGLLIISRTAYLVGGIGLIGVAILLYPRIENDVRHKWPMRLGYACILAVGVGIGFYYYDIQAKREDVRKCYVDLYERYAEIPEVYVDSTGLKVKHEDEKLEVVASLLAHNKNVVTLECIKLYLNPGLHVERIVINDAEVGFKRDRQVVIIDHSMNVDESCLINITYSGNIDERIAYLDVERQEVENARADAKDSPIDGRIGEKFAFLQENQVHLTREILWYPVGTSTCTPSSRFREEEQYGHFVTEIMKSGLVPITQGERIETDSSVLFISDKRLPFVTLTMGNYKHLSTKVDSCFYSIYYYDKKGHDLFIQDFEPLVDTLPWLIRRMVYEAEWGMQGKYLYKRFSFVEVPHTFTTYRRAWKGCSELIAPELVFYGEKRARIDKYRYSYGNQPQDEIAKKINDFRYTVKDPFMPYHSGKGPSIHYWRSLFYGFDAHITSTENNVMGRIMGAWKESYSPFYWLWWKKSNYEKGLFYLRNHSLEQALLDRSLSNALLTEILRIKAYELKSYLLSKLGRLDFAKSVKEFEKKRNFAPLEFEVFIEQLKAEHNVDIEPFYKKWYTSSEAPWFVVGAPYAAVVKLTEEERYKVTFPIRNKSDVDGMITIKMGFGSGEDESYHLIPANSCCEVKLMYERKPVAYELAQDITVSIPGKYSGTLYADAAITSDTVQGVIIVDDNEFLQDKNVIIINCEDKGFSIHNANGRRMLKDWLLSLNKTAEEENDKYISLSDYRIPQWRYMLAPTAYCDSIQSAVIKNRGEGNNYLEWKTIIPKTGTYEVFAWNNELRKYRLPNDSFYEYTALYGNEEEKLELNLNHKNGWYSFGNFKLNEGEEFALRLSDKTDAYLVIGDAIKLEYIED